jgi:hypothetical protein
VTPPVGWVRFEGPSRSFAIWRPPEWQLVPAVSQDAAFAALTANRSLVEVLRLETETDSDSPPGVRRVADAFASHAATLAPGPGMGVVGRRTMFSDGDASGERIIIGSLDQGHRVLTDYCIVGARERSLSIALKCFVGDWRQQSIEFERFVMTLTAPWLRREISPEDLTIEVNVLEVRHPGVAAIVGEAGGSTKGGCVVPLLIAAVPALTWIALAHH